MAVWLTHGSRAVGVDDAIIRATDFAALVSAEEVEQSAVRAREDMLAEARAEAQRLVNDAQAQADAQLAQANATVDGLLAAAQAEKEQARSAGFEQGMADAAADWAANTIDASEVRRRSLERQGVRLAGIVVTAVERVIEREDRTALFEHSLRSLLRTLKEVSLLTLRVCEADKQRAEAAVAEMAAGSRDDLRIEVVVDPAMSENGCRFESDQGIVDASLDVQLAAIRRAVERAAHRFVHEMQDDDGASAQDPFGHGDVVLAASGADAVAGGGQVQVDESDAGIEEEPETDAEAVVDAEAEAEADADADADAVAEADAQAVDGGQFEGASQLAAA